MSEAPTSISDSVATDARRGGDVPSGYKRTEVGVIPKDWCVCQLDSLGTGRTPPVKAGPFGSSLTKAMYVSTGYKVYGQEQVIRGDPQFGDYYIARKTYLDLEACAVHPGDILMSLVGTVGKLLVVPKNAELGIINPRLLRFSFDRNRILPPFFRFLFESEQSQLLLSRSMQGGTMGILNAGILRSLKIVVPLFAEQRAIAEALSDVDALLESLNALIAKKRAIKQGTMQQLLTGKTRLYPFTEEWQTRRLGTILAVKHGRTQPNEANPDGKFPILASGGELGRTDCFLYNKPSVLIGRKGTIDEPQYVSSPFWTIDTLFYTEIADGMDAKFLYYKFCTIPWRNYNEASGVPSLNSRTIENIEIDLPKLDEQHAITAVLSDMDTEIAGLESRHEKARAIKQGMMQQLLTGRVRLV